MQDQIKEILIKDPGKAATEIELKHSDFIAIVTRCHEQDYDTLKGVITKPFFYLGLIGSKAKRKQIFTRLIKEDGIDEKLLEKVHTPIGLKIKAETPEEIAVSIVAEMIQIKNQNK